MREKLLSRPKQNFVPSRKEPNNTTISGKLQRETR